MRAVLLLNKVSCKSSASHFVRTDSYLFNVKKAQGGKPFINKVVRLLLCFSV